MQALRGKNSNLSRLMCVFRRGAKMILTYTTHTLLLSKMMVCRRINTPQEVVEGQSQPPLN